MVYSHLKILRSCLSKVLKIEILMVIVGNRRRKSRNDSIINLRQDTFVPPFLVNTFEGTTLMQFIVNIVNY